MRRVRAFLRLSRLHFLAGGALGFALGAASAPSTGLGAYALGQLMITAAQLTAHYANEYADLEVDRAIKNRTSFSGGSGVLATGALAPRTALVAARVTALITVMTAVAVATIDWRAAALGMVALVVAWTYSMPPLRLLGTGTGELLTAFTVAAVVPLAGVTVQGAAIPPALWWIVAALVAVQFAMLLAFELPDLDADAATGKRVLGVRLGERRTIVTVATAFALAVAIVCAGALLGIVDSSVAVAGAAGIPLAVATVWAAVSRRHKATTFAAVAAYAVTLTAFTVAVALS